MPELTAAEIAALGYSGPSAGTVGITADDYRAQYQQHGRRLRWWKAFLCGDELIGEVIGPGGEMVERNGYVYIEQVLADDVRCMLYQTKRDFFDPEFGVVPKGSTGISVLPDEIELARLDRVALTDSAWIGRDYVKRGDGEIDELVRQPVVSISQVLFNGNFLNAANYISASNGVRWMGGQLAEGSLYSIEYRYLPMFEFLGEEQGVVQRGADGSFLPQRGAVNLKQPF